MYILPIIICYLIYSTTKTEAGFVTIASKMSYDKVFDEARRYGTRNWVFILAHLECLEVNSCIVSAYRNYNHNCDYWTCTIISNRRREWEQRIGSD